jgi:glycosyltransferase involved in cell wall biosynthesis
MSSMHIVQILPELNQGGVERGTVELSRELVKRGHRSTVISAGGKLAGQIEDDGGRHITLDVCSKNPLTAPVRILKLRRLFSDLCPPISVLHARSRVPAWLCRFANKKLKIPFVTTVHGFNSVSKYSAIMTKGDRVIYGSSAIKEYVLQNYPVDPGILRYVPRGIDVDYFDPDKVDQDFIQDFKQQQGLDGKKIITIVGRITEWKGHDTFIRATAEVQKKHPEAVGVVAGGVRHDKQDYFQTLEKLAADLGAGICFAGSQSNVREIYALSDLVVSAASTKAESFGRTAAEALAMNTPVIASAHGGSLDILIDSENGLLFEPGNDHDLAEKIEQALSREFENMREHIEENFSLNRMAEDELAVYRELLSEH